MLLADGFLERNSWVPGVLVAVVLFIIGTGITLYLRHRDRPTKTFDYCVISDAPILSQRPNDNSLKITYLDQELENPRLLQVQFTNTGTKIIRPTEILEPYVLTLGDVWLVSAEVIGSTRADLVGIEATCKPGEQGVLLHPATLNAGDVFTLQLIVDSPHAVETFLTGCVEEQTRPPGWYRTDREKRLLAQQILINALTVSLRRFGGLPVRD